MSNSPEPNTTHFVPVTRDMMHAIFDAIEPLIKSEDLFFDFGAGDGRVVEYARNFCHALGMEKNPPEIEHVPIKVGDFLTDQFPVDITVAYMNLITMPELLKLTGRLTQRCPNLRLIISARPLPQFEKKLVTTVKPPELHGHVLVFFGKWDIIKECTLDEMRRDNFRNIYATVQDIKMDADEHFYIYKVK